MIRKIKNRLASLRNKTSGIANFEKTSYSQSGEDLIIEFLFNQLGLRNPSYIDIGAHDPFYLNNTAIFYKKGCRGINIEPDSSLFQNFNIERKDDINLNIGIGENQGRMDFYIMNVPTLNTFSKEQVDLYSLEGNYFVKEIKAVDVSTLKIVIDQHNQGVFPDFLSLDAEGIDEIVIKSIDFDNRPKVICVETLSFSDSGQGVKNQGMIDYIKSMGYLLYADTYINSIFVDESTWRTQHLCP